MKAPDLSLVLPIHNQGSFIAGVLDDFRGIFAKEKFSYEIICVENGSKDDTLAVLREYAQKHKRIVVTVSKQGYGAAVIHGLAKAKGTYVCYMPSDGQLEAHLVPQEFKLITQKHYDLVKIKRVTRENWQRFVQSKVFNLLGRIVTQTKIKDINGSPRIFLRTWLPILRLESPDSFIDTEMALKTRILNWKIVEIPAPTLPRVAGESTVSYKTVFEFIKNLINFPNKPSMVAWKNKQARV
ncbi:glycosyltransferase family 2 protein [Candidatus Microgenomates bacterium]|nr:MAG: glycosyltransferase family 2 protein [Candidatus Microgenomates bacterium]